MLILPMNHTRKTNKPKENKVMEAKDYKKANVIQFNRNINSNREKKNSCFPFLLQLLCLVIFMPSFFRSGASNYYIHVILKNFILFDFQK